MLAAALLVLYQPVRARATTSLWGDELHTIREYSSKGPIAVVTDYREPNNHIFFNLLNAVTPNRASVQPLRARLWSFIALAALLASVLGYFLGRGDPLSGALLVWVLSASSQLVDLDLQARGYGLLAFLAFVASASAVTFLEKGRTGALLALGAASVLGAFTVPTFGFFAAGLWLCVLVARRERRVVAAGAASGVAILFVHLPVLSQMADQARHYDERWGRQYGHPGAPFEALQLYLLHPSVLLGRLPGTLGLVLFALLLAGLCAVVWWKRRSLLGGPLVIGGAVAVFFAICLALTTPLLRSTAFVVVAVAFGFVLLLSAASTLVPERIRAAVALVLAFVILRQSVHLVRAFHFVPEESWMELASVLRETFPGDLPLTVNAAEIFLEPYLAGDARREPALDVPAWARGEQVYVDAPVDAQTEPRVDGREYAPFAVTYRLPQRREGYQAVWFCPPLESSLAGTLPDFVASLSDRELATGSPEIASRPGEPPRLEITLRPGRYRSLVIVTGGVGEVTAEEVRGETAVPLGPIRRSGDVTLVALGDREVSRIRIVPVRGNAATLPSVRELWAYPVRSRAAPHPAH